MFKQSLQHFQLLALLIDFFLSLLAALGASLLYFHFLAPHKLAHISPDASSYFISSLLFHPLTAQAWSGHISYAQLSVFFAFSQAAVLFRSQSLQTAHITSPASEFVAILKGISINFLFCLAVISFYRGTSFSRPVLLMMPCLSMILVWTGRILFRKILARLYMRGKKARNIFLIGTGPQAYEFFSIIEKRPYLGYRILGVFGQPLAKSHPMRPLYLGGHSFLPKALQKYKPSLVCYADKYNPAKIGRALRLCDQDGVQCHIVPNLKELIWAYSHIEQIDGLSLMIVNDTPLHDNYNKFAKRLFDLLFAMISLSIALPFMLIIALLIKLDSRGPVLFSQERIGLDRKGFTLWKFRTMYAQSQKASDKKWGIQGRGITRLGRILRKYSLDELPQIWNILLGNMSVVGPRPERPFFVQKFQKEYKQYMRRHAAKGGLTGWAQIQGLRGDTSISKRVEADIYYIENWSLWLDIQIVLKTIPAIFRSPGE